MFLRTMALIISAALASGQRLPEVKAEMSWTGYNVRCELDLHLDQGRVAGLLLHDQLIKDEQTLEECGVFLNADEDCTRVTVTAVICELIPPEYKYAYGKGRSISKVKISSNMWRRVESATIHYSDGTIEHLNAPRAHERWRTLEIVEKQWQALRADIKRWGFVSNVSKSHSQLHRCLASVTWLPVEHATVRRAAVAHAHGKFCIDDVVVYTGSVARHAGKDLIAGTIGIARESQDDKLEADVQFPHFGKCRCNVHDLRLTEAVFVHSIWPQFAQV